MTLGPNDREKGRETRSKDTETLHNAGRVAMLCTSEQIQ